ncbi:MAG: hypothetical protein GF317_05595 [Candidatus Lokiarchaeota archaeon]|nr:hypothetical protein [Candidatus Lokiarchaeota archaeon]MBD3199281.1 hypothetical protein [Candidatus Lokiarchaeota archaeon]
MTQNLKPQDREDPEKKLDLTKLKPYGDSMNDGKVQVSFTLPVKISLKAIEAAKYLAVKMGLRDPLVAHSQDLDNGFSFFIIYGELKHNIDYTNINVSAIDLEIMSLKEINNFIKKKFKRKLIVIGASTGTDAHTVGIDAIMNIKGYAGHYGLEGYEMIKAYNLGAQVSNEEFVKKAIEENADILLVSQTVTEKNIHVQNLTHLVDLLEAENIREGIILICGGARISNNLAKELGFDAGFGSGTSPEMVATFFVKEMDRRLNS